MDFVASGITGRLRFQPCRPVPAYPIKRQRARRERRHPKASITGRASPIDPLENTICAKETPEVDVLRTKRTAVFDASNGRKAGPQGSPREGPESAPEPPFRCKREIRFTARSRPSFVGPRRRSGVVQRRLRQPRASEATKLVAVVNVTTAGRSASKSRRRCSRARTR